jgi:hypothetical protein
VERLLKLFKDIMAFLMKIDAASGWPRTAGWSEYRNL